MLTLHKPGYLHADIGDEGSAGVCYIRA